MCQVWGKRLRQDNHRFKVPIAPKAAQRGRNEAGTVCGHGVGSGETEYRQERDQK